MATDPDMPAGLTHEVAVRLRDWTVRANDYSRSRKNKFRLFSSATKILSLLMSGAATIILGLQDLTFWAGLGFSLVALTTVVNAVEPFFNWRSRWVLAEEAQQGFYRLQEDLEYRIATRQPDELQVEDLDEFYRRYKKIWNEFSEKWLEDRRRVTQGGGN